MKKFLIAAALILWTGLAVAQHSHGSSKGPNGGPMQDVVGVHGNIEQKRGIAELPS